ncbi:hypothetical protein D3C72_2187030 [compost metagenome]
MSAPRATVRIGNAAMMITLVTSTVQVNTGIFINVMPGARMRRMVMNRLTPVSNVPMPEACNAQM